ncbi:MAG: hypothetical protein SFX72_20210 [Isosphaeraceae bacterium]|nr:hypothetical protein [Isosphaeraceae bacterium]
MSTESVVSPLNDRTPVSTSKVVGIYQMLLRRYVEHFFPDARLEPAGDRSFIFGEGGPDRVNYRIADDPNGLGVEIEWFRSRYLIVPGSPTPFLPSERRLIRSILRILDFRYRSMYDTDAGQRSDLFHFAVEDFIVTDFIDPPSSGRLPIALEAIRVASLSTYENRRVSTGALLLGTNEDPASSGRTSSEGAPRYNVRLTALKGFHRICDGLHTVYLVDREGDLTRAIDIHRWADRTQPISTLPHPCPRPYLDHARATVTGRHVCIVLTPSQEIKIFADGTLTFAFSDARWRLLDIPTKYAGWCRAVGAVGDGDLPRRIFQAGLNLAEARKGALFVVLRDTENSVPHLIAPADRMGDEIPIDDPEDPDNLSPRVAKRSLHHVVRGQDLLELDPRVLEAIAGIDGAVVTDRTGKLLTFGAILRIAPESARIARAIEGARTLAALAASFHGPVLKVSEDGLMTMFLGGRRVWDL